MNWLNDRQKDLFGKVFDNTSILPKNKKNSYKLRALSFFSTDTKSVKQMTPYIIELEKGNQLPRNQYYNALRNSGLISQEKEKEKIIINEFGELFLEYLHENDDEALNAIINSRDSTNISDKYILPLELIILLAVYSIKNNKKEKLATFDTIENINYFKLNILDSILEYEQHNFDIKSVFNYEDDDLFLMLQGINYQGFEIKRLIHLKDEISEFKELYMKAYKECPSDDKNLEPDEVNYFEQIKYFKKYQKDIRYRVKKTFYLSLILEGIVFSDVLANKIFGSTEEKRNFVSKYGLENIIKRCLALINNCKDNTELKFESKYKVFLDDYTKSFPHNQIIFGAPGTGKSFYSEKRRKELLKKGGGYERVTFHPDYSYANFVGTYKPTMLNTGDISYEYIPGPFMRVLISALKNVESDNPRPHLLMIEEINRSNVSAVFGDIFQLLDRDINNISEYSIEASEDIKKYLAKEFDQGGNYSKIKIPNNMYIWATMNSADQGVFPMDTAFKRRWEFKHIGIDDGEDIIEGLKVKLGKGEYEKEIEWNLLRKAINDELSSYKINEDKLLGPFFLSLKVLEKDNDGYLKKEKFVDAFMSKIIMYLFEDAAKQKRATLFNNEEIDTNKYSSICKEFEEKGVRIFNDTIFERIERNSGW